MIFKTRADGINWAKGIMRPVVRKDYVVLDFKTTGLTNPAVVQAALVGHNGKSPVTLVSTLVDPEQEIEVGASKIHGITQKMVNGYDSFAIVSKLLEARMRSKHVIIYNRKFGQSVFIHQYARYWGATDAPGIKYHCAMEAAACVLGEWNDYYQNWKWIKLVDACRALKVKVNHAHDATADCYMTWALIEAMSKLEE